MCACGIEQTDWCREYPTICTRCHEDHVDASPRPKYPNGHSQTLCNGCWLDEIFAMTKCEGCGALTPAGVAVFGDGYACRCARNHGPLFGHAP